MFEKTHPKEYSLFRIRHPYVFGSLMNAYLRGYTGMKDCFSEPSSVYRQWYKLGKKDAKNDKKENR